MRPIEHHVIPAAVVKRSMDVLKSFGTDIWLFSHDQWLIRDPDGEYVGVEARAIRCAPTVVRGFCALSGRRLQDRRREFGSGACCSAARTPCSDAVGTEATAVRSQTFYLDITPPGHDKGTFVEAMARRLGIATSAIATIGDMENDLPMFAKSGDFIRDGPCGGRDQAARD